MASLKAVLPAVVMASQGTSVHLIRGECNEDLEVATATMNMAVQQSKNQATQVPSPPTAQQGVPLCQLPAVSVQISPTLPQSSAAALLPSCDHNGPPQSPVNLQSCASSSAAHRRLHVTNLPFKVKDDQLRKLFEEHGVVADAEIIYNERGSKGFGFVTMATVEDAIKARDALHGMELQGRRIEVNNATPRTMPLKVGTKRTLLATTPGSGTTRTRTYGPSYTGNWNAATYLASLGGTGSTAAASTTAATAAMPIAVAAPASPISFPLDPQQAQSFAAGFAAAQLSQQMNPQDSYTAYYNYALSQVSQQQHLAYRGNFPNLASGYGSCRFQPY